MLLRMFIHGKTDAHLRVHVSGFHVQLAQLAPQKTLESNMQLFILSVCCVLNQTKPSKSTLSTLSMQQENLFKTNFKFSENIQKTKF